MWLIEFIGVSLADLPRGTDTRISHTLHGLASSLFLNVGLTRVAEKFDPMLNRAGNAIQEVTSAGPCIACETSCNFTAEAGQ